MLGHKKLETSAIYAKRDSSLAQDAETKRNDPKWSSHEKPADNFHWVCQWGYFVKIETRVLPLEVVLENIRDRQRQSS